MTSTAAINGQLALTLQELFTVTGRLRDGRVRPPDADSFRNKVKGLVTAANDEGIANGYVAKDVSLALYAAVALLDESVFNSGLGVSAEWARKPLQDELFGEHKAGENFFQYVTKLMQRDDSTGLADLLEVYQLCLLLGFRGKYGVRTQSGVAPGGSEELTSISRRLGERIHRIRGEPPPLSSGWKPISQEAIDAHPDPWVRRLSIAAVVIVIVAAVLFGLYRLLLPAGIPR